VQKVLKLHYVTCCLCSLVYRLRDIFRLWQPRVNDSGNSQQRSSEASVSSQRSAPLGTPDFEGRPLGAENRRLRDRAFHDWSVFNIIFTVSHKNTL